jgi:hypothetical protein
MNDKTVTAWQIFPNDNRVEIRPSTNERDWMDRTNNRFSYKCLPLLIANMHGWGVYAQNRIVVNWNGGLQTADINLKEDGQGTAQSLFGYGIVTLQIMHLITTPPGYNLYVTGMPNHIKKNITALTGVIETDWSPYTFTMNWQITEPNYDIVFEPGEPICWFFPVQRTLFDDFNYEHRNLAENPTLQENFYLFQTNRMNHKYSQSYNKGDYELNYFRGQMPDGSGCPISDHRTKLRLDGGKR